WQQFPRKKESNNQGKNAVKIIRQSLNKKVHSVLARFKKRYGANNQSRNINRPYIKRNNGSSRRGRRIHHIRKLLVGDVMLISYRSHRSAGKHRADGAPLMKDEPHHPGEKLSAFRSADNLISGPLSKAFGTAGARPYTDESAERPEVN